MTSFGHGHPANPEQLQSIDAGDAFRAIAQQANYIELTEVRRQHHPWQQEATQELATQQTEKALERHRKAGCIHEFETAAIARAPLLSNGKPGGSRTPRQAN